MGGQARTPPAPSPGGFINGEVLVDHKTKSVNRFHHITSPLRKLLVCSGQKLAIVVCLKGDPFTAATGSGFPWAGGCAQRQTRAASVGAAVACSLWTRSENPLRLGRSGKQLRNGP